MQQKPKQSGRKWFQTNTGATLGPAPQERSHKKISGIAIRMMQDQQDWDEWVDLNTNPAENINLTVAVAKGRNKTQLCFACHDPFNQDRLRWGTPDPLRQSAELYCPDCFKRLGCVTVA